MRPRVAPSNREEIRGLGRGACSVYESDSAGVLADRRESDDRQAPLATVGAGAVPAFTPKRNSEAAGNKPGLIYDAPRPEFGETRAGELSGAKTCFAIGAVRVPLYPETGSRLAPS